ncbi:MAG: ABC transporter ATP-binding protein [Pseudomonadota bacterium]
MLLTVTDLQKSFPGDSGPVPVLDGISLQLPAGDALALTGESGSGKSTLLHVIAGLEVPEGGTVTLDGADLAQMDDTARARLRRETVSVIFQQFNLIPSLDVAANIAFQARLADRHDPDWCATLTERLGLTDHTTKYPEQLSGGQQQRVAIGRALAGKPPLVLADEPTGNLDEATGDAVINLMLDLVAETGAGLLMVTHSDRLAARLSRRLHLSRGRVA